MNIEKIQVTVKELANGYEEKGPDGIEGVVAYGGKLDVRPAYQREFVYEKKERDEVIRTVKKGFPLNTMYWAKTDDGRFELMDGQQRTVSICRYAAESERTFAVDEKYYFNLEEDIQKTIDNYLLDIYICDGTPSEIHDWFKVINIAGKELTPQELRNTSYTGPWLSDAKLHFSKPNCAGYKMGKDYITGSPIRQELLQTVIDWIADRDGLPSIEEYMGLHQHDENADEIWNYYRSVIEWVETLFPVKRTQMKGIAWGKLYNRYKGEKYDPQKLEDRIKELFANPDITRNRGVYEYLITGDERCVSIRAFPEGDKQIMYERQNHRCAICGKQFDFSEMHGDHIKPWSKGGRTTLDNGQMLCTKCNLKKGAQ